MLLLQFVTFDMRMRLLLRLTIVGLKPKGGHQACGHLQNGDAAGASDRPWWIPGSLPGGMAVGDP